MKKLIKKINNVTITTSNDGRSLLEVEIFGPYNEVEVTLDNYFQEYSPYGYGTKLYKQEALPNGDYKLYIYRYASCD